MSESDQSEENIFPLVNRRTPVLDRIRDNDEGSSGIGEDIGKMVGESIKEDNEERLEEQRQQLEENFRRSLGESLDVPPEAINGEAVASVGRLVTDLDESNILTETARKQLGIIPTEDDEEDDDSYKEELEDEDEESSSTVPVFDTDGEDE